MTQQCLVDGCEAEATVHEFVESTNHTYHCDSHAGDLTTEVPGIHPITEGCVSGSGIFSVDRNACRLNNVSVFGQEPRGK